MTGYFCISVVGYRTASVFTALVLRQEKHERKNTCVESRRHEKGPFLMVIALHLSQLLPKDKKKGCRRFGLLC